MHFDLILRGGTVALPTGLERVDLGIVNGQVSSFSPAASATYTRLLDVSGLHVLPGVIDTQVHFREPGLTHKEDIASGSASAALGGVTCFFEMPNTSPNTDSVERLRDKLAIAAKSAWVDFAFYGGATKENIEALPALEREPGCSGIKMFCGSSTGSLLVDDETHQLRVFRSGTRRVACHSEDEARLLARKAMTAGQSVSFHPVWRDEQAAFISTERIVRLSQLANRRIHVLHVTTAEELPLLAAHRDLVTCEVTPQHLTLTSPECYERLGSLAQMNPPIREARHQAALWEAVRSGLFDVLGSDHAPHTREEKALSYPASPSGMPGVQTLLPVMLNHVHHQRLSLERLIQLTSSGPARVFDIARKGKIEVGFDADFSVVDLARTETITNQWSRSRCGWTPFEGMRVTGWPIHTIVRGNVVVEDGALVGGPIGQAVSF
jgi:dihydroorotase